MSLTRCVNGACNAGPMALCHGHKWICEPIDLEHFDRSEIVASWEVSDPDVPRESMG